MLSREGCKPDRDFTKIHSKRILVHAIKAVLRHLPLRIEQDILVGRHLGTPVDVVSLYEFFRDLTARLDQECAGSHRRITYLEIENLFGRRSRPQVCKDRTQCRSTMGSVSSRGV